MTNTTVRAFLSTLACRVTTAAMVTAAGAALLLSGAESDIPTVTVAPSAQPTQVISEDDPRWDCTTMGNRQCGPNAVAPAAPANDGTLTDNALRCVAKNLMLAVREGVEYDADGVSILTETCATAGEAWSQSDLELGA